MIRALDEIVCHLKNAVLFLVFITLCIGSSSVTIRVEMRWVYVAYAAALLFFAYQMCIRDRWGFSTCHPEWHIIRSASFTV